MQKNVITLSETYRRIHLTPFGGHQKGDPSNLVTFDRMASYREKEYTRKFGEFMQEWVSFSEDWRNYQDHSIFHLESAFHAFKVATANHSALLRRSVGVEAEVDFRRVCRVAKLSDDFSIQFLALCHLEPLYGGEADNHFVSDEINSCFIKIDEILRNMEDEFGLILHKRPALPAPS